MLESGTDPESYITEYTLVYEDYSEWPTSFERIVNGIRERAVVPRLRWTMHPEKAYREQVW